MKNKGLILYLTNGCNLNCNYCFVNKNNKQILDFDKYREIIEKYKNDISYITFFGGEPLLCIDLIKKIINYNKTNNYNYYYILNTNGTLLNKDIINLIINNNILVNASLDGNLLSNKNRFNKNIFNVVIKNIKELLNNNIDVIINYVITPNNIEYFHDSLLFFKDNNIKEICLLINYDIKWNNKDINEFKNQLYESIDLFNKDLKVYPIDSKIHLLKDNLEEHKCDFGNENIVVSQEGDLYPCISFIDEKYKNKSEYINEVNTSNCNNCSYLKYCINNCMCRSINVNGFKFNCKLEKIYIDLAKEIINKTR